MNILFRLHVHREVRKNRFRFRIADLLSCNMAQIEIFKSAEESAAHVVSGRSILFASIGHVTREVLSVLTKYIYLKTNRPVKTIHVSGKKKLYFCNTL